MRLGELGLWNVNLSYGREMTMRRRKSHIININNINRMI